MKHIHLKLLLKSIITAVTLTSLIAFIPFEKSCKNISQDVFRLHIIANSNNTDDQELKLKVRDAILKQTDSLYQNAHSIIEAKKLTSENLSLILNTAKNTITENGYSYDVNAEITNMHFDTRHYDNITMPSGQYDALRVTIGKASGKNWWCVMYPALCVGSASNYQELEENLTPEEYAILTGSGTQYELKFKVVEYFEKITSYLQ